MKEIIQTDKGIIKREYGKTPNGNDINGRWVFRDENNVIIDFDKYRHDLLERNNLKVIEKQKEFI